MLKNNLSKSIFEENFKKVDLYQSFGLNFWDSESDLSSTLVSYERLGIESESQRFYKRLKLESEFCLEDSNSSPSLAEIFESEALTRETAWIWSWRENNNFFWVFGTKSILNFWVIAKCFKLNKMFF